MRVTKKRAAKNYPAQGIKKGDEYYSWKFYRGRKIISKTPPKQSQLTQRADYSALREAQEAADEIEWEAGRRERMIEQVSDVISQLEAARDASQEKYDNMPEQWQGADMGQNAENFCSECDEAISELESIKSQLEDEEEEFNDIGNPTDISWPQEY